MTEVSRPKVAFITGITGQDGSYLAELLLAKGYQVHGMVRPASTNNRTRIQHLYPNQGEDSRLKLHFGDMTEFSDIHRIISTVKPAEIYNLAGQTHIDLSFGNPEDTANANALGTLRLLEAIKKCGLGETVRFFQASSCDMFSGGQKISSDPISLSENTAFHPSSPYGNSNHTFVTFVTTNNSKESLIKCEKVFRRCSVIGLSGTTGRPTICSCATEFCSTTRARAAVKIS